MFAILVWLLIFGGIGYLIAGDTGMWVGLGIIFGFWMLIFAFLCAGLAFLTILFGRSK